MGFLNLLSSKKVPMMKEAPTTERMEVTFSATSKVWACDEVIGMATVGCAVPPYVHTEVQVTVARSKNSQRAAVGEGHVFCVQNALVVVTGEGLDLMLTQGSIALLHGD